MDNALRFEGLVLRSLLRFRYFPYNSGTHVKYFAKGREVYDVYYGFLIRISAQHVADFKPVMMRKLVGWLREHDSEECAEWWEKYWTPFRDPRRGAVTLADCEYVSCTNQNIQEGKSRPVKRGHRVLDMMPRAMSDNPLGLFGQPGHLHSRFQSRARGVTHSVRASQRIHSQSDSDQGGVGYAAESSLQAALLLCTAEAVRSGY